MISMMVARHHAMVSRAGTVMFYKALGDLSTPSLHDICRAH